MADSRTLHLPCRQQERRAPSSDSRAGNLPSLRASLLQACWVSAVKPTSGAYPTWIPSNHPLNLHKPSYPSRRAVPLSSTLSLAATTRGLWERPSRGADPTRSNESGAAALHPHSPWCGCPIGILLSGSRCPCPDGSLLGRTARGSCPSFSHKYPGLME